MEIVVEVAMEAASEADMDTALGAVVEIVEYMLALLPVEMSLLSTALRMKGFCTGMLGFCVLVVRSRQVVVGRDETCRSVEKVLDGAVFELPDAVVDSINLKIDYHCLERLVFPSHTVSMLSVQSLSVFSFSTSTP